MLTPINRMAWRKSAIARGEIKALPSPSSSTKARKQATALLRNLDQPHRPQGAAHGLLALLRHSSPPHGQEFDGEVDLAGFHHAGERAEVAARALAPALPAIPGGIVLVELQNINHGDRRPDRADLLHLP
jgi:hypothetical protein